IYILVTKGKIPAYLGSSFAFLSPVFVVLGHYSGGEGYGYALGGFLMVGIVLVVIAGIVKVAGTGWIDVLFPPAAMGAILAVIGLGRGRDGVDLGAWIAPDNAGADGAIQTIAALVALYCLGVTIICRASMRGFLTIIPIPLGSVLGYIGDLFSALVDLTMVRT